MSRLVCRLLGHRDRLILGWHHPSALSGVWCIRCGRRWGTR